MHFHPFFFFLFLLFAVLFGPWALGPDLLITPPTPLFAPCLIYFLALNIYLFYFCLMSFNFIYLHIIFISCFMFNNIKNAKKYAMSSILFIIAQILKVQKNMYCVVYFCLKSKRKKECFVNLALRLFLYIYLF
jgi:hypothetical protein